MPETYTKEQLWAQLDELGEPKVRERFITHVYGDAGDRRALVEEWLRQKDQSRSDSSKREMLASSLEQILIARSAKNAAWAAAIAAIIAAICAAVAIGISLLKQ